MKIRGLNNNKECILISNKCNFINECSDNSDELKSQWTLADTILQKDNKLYVCMKTIDV